MIDKTHKVKELIYFGRREANIEIEWFDKEENKMVIMRGIVEEVQE